MTTLIILVIALAAWRRWEGAAGTAPTVAKWAVLLGGLAPLLYHAWGWQGAALALLLLEQWLNRSHDWDRVSLRYWPVGYLGDWLRRRQGVRPDLWPVRPIAAGWTEWFELAIGAWTGLVLGLALLLT